MIAATFHVRARIPRAERRARDDEDVAVDVRRRRERDDLSDEVDGRGGKRERRR